MCGNSIAHIRHPTADTFKLLQKYNFDFNIYNHSGMLPIHSACFRNSYQILSWMIDEKIFDINCKTKYAKRDNGKTPLHYAILGNSVECVDLLCKQWNIAITKEEISVALDCDSVELIKLLFCRLFTKHKISQWSDIEKQNENSDSLISSRAVEQLISDCKTIENTKCYSFFL